MDRKIPLIHKAPNFIKHGMETNQLKYTRIWHRAGAYILDFLILSPLWLLSRWGNWHFRVYGFYQIVPFVVLSLFYHVYLVRRFGGEPGKLIFGMRIRQLDGSPVKVRQALLRYLSTCLVAVLLIVASTAPLLHMSDEEFRTFRTLSSRERLHREAEIASPWVAPVKTACKVWLAGDAIVLLLSSKRRAIHDFIGQTVVLYKAHSGPPTNI